MTNIRLLAQRAAEGWHRGRRSVAVLALLGGLTAASIAPAAALSTTAASGAAKTSGAVSSHSTLGGSSARAAQARVNAYWTPTRLKAAKSLDTITAAPAAALAAQVQAHPNGPAVSVPGSAPAATAPVPARVRPLTGSVGTPWTGNYYAPPATTTGKVYFTDHTGGEWVCSASTVNSGGKDAVFTAGHCVYGTAGGELPAGETWHSNWEFVPDYYYGYEPYGAWYACQLWTMTNYINSGDLPDDMGAAVMCTNNGQHIVNVVGGQGIAWNYSANQYVYDFGYPAAYPFDGQSLQECDGYEFDSPYISGTIGLACDFTGGSSGGPWLGWFDGTFGYVNGVNSYGLGGLPGYIFSPYFGNNAGNLYNAVANL